MLLHHFLVGGWPTPLKNMKVNGKDYPIYYGNIMENKKCLKPPTSFKMFTYFSRYFGASRYNIYIHAYMAHYLVAPLPPPRDGDGLHMYPWSRDTGSYTQMLVIILGRVWGFGDTSLLFIGISLWRESNIWFGASSGEVQRQWWLWITGRDPSSSANLVHKYKN